MEIQTNMIEEIFKKESVYVTSWEPYYVHKFLNVSDPHNWYCCDKIICSMYHPKYWNDDSIKNTVRILFKSYDDFISD